MRKTLLSILLLCCWFHLHFLQQQLPKTVPAYVKANFPTAIITKVNTKVWGFEVELNSGLEVEFNPYFRWNFLKLSDRFNLFADATASFGCNGQLSLVTHFANLGFTGKGSKIEYGLGVIIDSSVGLYWNF